MSADSVASIVWDVMKSCVIVPIKRGFRYVISSKSFADGLREEVRNLENEAQRVRILAEVARSNLRNFYDCFTEWQQSADKALEEARDLLGDIDKANKMCWHGTLPDPKFRYHFSRKAEHKIDIIKQLAQKCSGFKELNDICFSAPALGNVAAPTPARIEGKDVVQSNTTTASASPALSSIKFRENDIFESRALIMRDIMDALADNNNSVVGIYGMGGVGKSTLLMDVERRIREEKLFDWVAKADVSENPDIKKIQGDIADALGLSDIKNKEYVSGRAELLHRRLEDEERQQKKVLIILDNLWEDLNLKSVGIPCGLDNKVRGCKLLLTSRDRHVLRREMRCNKAFLLDVLKEEEAKRLFETMVGGKVHVDFEPLADEALRISAGLPFLICAMAKLFIDASLSELSDALNQIELSTDEGISAVINKVLQLSYDRLKSEEAKSLLQLCAAYGISEPSVENLVRYSFGWGIFQKDSSMKNARDRLFTHICTLQASSLLLDNGGGDGFKIHDLVRDFVARFILRDHPLLLLKDKDMLAQLQKEKLKSCTAICFPYINMKELPEELDCPELHIFLLFSNNESLEVPNSYFNSMRKLAVLNLTGIRLTSSPMPFQFSENLHTLCLQRCLLEDVAILGKLKGLQILSFVDSEIQRLPKEIGQLVELRLLDLRRSQLEIIEPGVLQSLIKLEELYMENSFDQWNAMEQTPPTNASLIELDHMKNLYTLYVSIPDLSVLPGDLNVEKLTKYRIQIGNAWRWLSECKGSRTLELKLDRLSDVHRKGCIQNVLGKIDDLLLNGLDGSEQSVCALLEKGFIELKHLQVENSPSIHYILQRPSLIAFEMLESLLLKKLINLKKICYSHISSSKSFSTLKVIRVESCNKIEVLFPLSLLRGLPQLEEIEVVGCKLMHGIVEADDCGKVELCNLHTLKLRDLPNIKNFFSTRIAPSSSTSNDQVNTQVAFFNGQQVAFHSLETLYITGLDNIKMIWDNEVSADSFSKLKLLVVEKCNKLVNVVHSFILEWLVSLERLEASYCGSVEVVFELQPLNCLDRHPINLPLKELIISGLPKLKCVWDKELHHHVKFQGLHSIWVFRCESLTSLIPASVARDLMQLEELKIDECGIVELIEKEEGLVPKFVFPNLTFLELKHLSELKCLYTGTHTSHWPALKTLKVDGCNKVEILASQTENEMPRHKQPLFLMKKGAFPNLQELKLDLSKWMEIWHGHYHDGELLCKLRVLELHHLSKESHKSTCRFVESLTNLEELVVCESYLEQPGSKEEAIEGTSHELKVVLPFPGYIQHLQTLDVSHFDGLSNMFTPTIAENLVALTKLKISNCRILTEVISDEEVKEGHVVAFNQLKYMELNGLIELRCFSSGGCTLMFPILEDVIVTECPNMKFFSKGTMEAPKLKRVRVSTDAAAALFWKENLNITIRNMSEEMATVAGVKEMWLSEFSELIGKWHSQLNPIKSSWQLKILVVDKCPSFINAIPSKLMVVLEKMTSLQVRNCESLEEIFGLEGLETVESTQVLPRLQHLNLVNLPKLRQLWNKDLQGMMRFNSLYVLTLYKCSNLRHAFSPSMAQCLANLA